MFYSRDIIQETEVVIVPGGRCFATLLPMPNVYMDEYDEDMRFVGVTSPEEKLVFEVTLALQRWDYSILEAGL